MSAPRCAVDPRGGEAAPESRASPARSSGGPLGELAQLPRQQARLSGRYERPATMCPECRTRLGKHEGAQSRPSEITVVAGDAAPLPHRLKPPVSRATGRG